MAREARLSERRSLAVARRLMELGIDAEILTLGHPPVGPETFRVVSEKGGTAADTGAAVNDGGAWSAMKSWLSSEEAAPYRVDIVFDGAPRTASRP
jgi:hypothetical protein